MPATRSFYLELCIVICHLLALVTSTIHCLIYSIGIRKISPEISNAPVGKPEHLRRIWFVRFLKRIVSITLRTPLRSYVTNLLTIDFNERIRKNTVIVCCHTPWARFIAYWCDQNNYSMIVAGRAWKKRVNIASHVDNHSQIKDLLKHLQGGGRVIIMADVFNDANDCPVAFMGKKYNASLFPLRLAQAAGANVIAVVPEIKNNSISIAIGPEFNFADVSAGSTLLMQNIFTYLESQIRKDPSVWLKFIRNCSADQEMNEKFAENYAADPIEMLNVERPEPTI